ncbi:MAG: Phage integrase family protein [Firmicutes bacterium ADurb.Bin193]|nr:MAG: Phage integrase family protein [Firmicutes bacterium ADurb.Bin193]
MVGKIIDLWGQPEFRREDYHYGLYNHRLILKDGIIYSRSFIVIKNRFGVIARFTNLHNYAEIYENKVFVPITSDVEAKLHYICMMLNYVLIQHYECFRVDHVFKISREALECFFRDYATEKLPNGKHRGEQSIEKCVYAVTTFFRKLRWKFGSYILLAEGDLYTEKAVYNKYGKFQKKTLPAFQVKGIPKTDVTFRELPTKAFKILLNLAFRYAPDIAFAICLQAFAGLRAGEVLNVRQEGSPMGSGLIFTRIENRTIKVEIDLTREMPMRSDGVICGKIKKERRQCVYPPFLEAFIAAYEHHRHFLVKNTFEADYRPMFINSRGMAMTYDDYANRFTALVDNHFRPVLLECDDPECRIYGQLLYENRLTAHSLRHWYSTQLVLHGEDIAQIQYWRGDKNPESAFAYLQDKGDLVRELERANDFLAEILMDMGEKEVVRRHE